MIRFKKVGRLGDKQIDLGSLQAALPKRDVFTSWINQMEYKGFAIRQTATFCVYKVRCSITIGCGSRQPLCRPATHQPAF